MEHVNNRTQMISKLSMTSCLVILCCLFSGVVYSGSKEDTRENEALIEAQRLAGQWVRPDGGYRLVVEDIQPDGSVKASYYNPGKINVHEANWKVEEKGVHLFVELRDENYPGSKYSLVHMKEKDVLVGTYFQALQRKTFEVYFTRIGSDSE